MPFLARRVLEQAVVRLESLRPHQLRLEHATADARPRTVPPRSLATPRLLPTVDRYGVEVVYLEATTEDVAVAERLAPLLFGALTVADPAPQTRRLLALLDTLVVTQAKENRCRREDIQFTRR